MHIRWGDHQFEIVKEKRLFVGYYDEKRSVTGPDREVVVRVLVKKHISKSPEAVICRFPSGERIS